MTTYYLNGTALQEGADFTINGMTYPYSWLEGTSASVRASLGIEAAGDVNFDPKYYWDKNIPKNLEDIEEVDADGNPKFEQVLDFSSSTFGLLVNSDKRLITKGLKTNCTAEVKIKTNQLLEPTDYLIIRKEVEGTEIPTEVSTYRAAVIAEQNRVVPAIAATTTVEELIEVMQSITWPKAE